MDGEGTMVFSSGNTYKGSFSKGLRNGKGILLFKATGDSYDGEWQQDKMTGKGKYTYMQEMKIYEGEF